MPSQALTASYRGRGKAALYTRHVWKAVVKLCHRFRRQSGGAVQQFGLTADLQRLTARQLLRGICHCNSTYLTTAEDTLSAE